MTTQALQHSITSPEAFIASVPALVGFTPHQSLVVAFLRHDQLVVTMRVDLPNDWSEVNESIITTCSNVLADEVLIVVWDKQSDCTLPYGSELTALAQELHDHGIGVADALHVAKFGFRSYLDPSVRNLNPKENHSVPLQGYVSGDFQQTREDLVQRYQPKLDLTTPSTVIESEAKHLISDIAERACQAWDAVQAIAESGTNENAAELRALIQLAVTDVRVRDFVMCQIVMHPDPQPLLDVVVQTALRAPVSLRPRCAGMAAALLGALNPSTIPVACMIELAQGDSLAELVTTSLGSAVPPSAMREVLAQSLPLVLTQLEGSNK